MVSGILNARHSSKEAQEGRGYEETWPSPLPGVEMGLEGQSYQEVKRGDAESILSHKQDPASSTLTPATKQEVTRPFGAFSFADCVSNKPTNQPAIQEVRL